jgi:hypothetical protein
VSSWHHSLWIIRVREMPDDSAGEPPSLGESVEMIVDLSNPDTSSQAIPTGAGFDDIKAGMLKKMVEAVGVELFHIL